MSRFVTIKDIASQLHISVATVSRALRDTYDVNRETREKVLEMARKLNYKPNVNAMGLAGGKTFNIGVILPFITNYYFSTVITGIQEIAYAKGYNIVLFITNDSPEREVSIIRDLAVSAFDGFLVSTCATHYDHFNSITDKGIPVIFFDRVPTAAHTARVMQDDYRGAFDATEHLIAQGYHKIAHLAGPRDIAMTERRLKGYQDALEKHRIPFLKKFVLYSGFSQECGGADAAALLKGKDIPDALFAINDRKAIGAMLHLRQQKIRIGRDIGVAGFTNDPMSAIISPSLTTVAEPAFAIGRVSCELLLKQIAKRKCVPEEIILPNTLIVRESTCRN
jgi:LacI family transcriptional regulator